MNRLFLLPSEKRSSLKGKNLHPKFFPFIVESRFRRGLVYRNANRKSQKLSPMSEMAENPPSVSTHLRILVLL